MQIVDAQRARQIALADHRGDARSFKVILDREGDNRLIGFTPPFRGMRQYIGNVADRLLTIPFDHLEREIDHFTAWQRLDPANLQQGLTPDPGALAAVGHRPQHVEIDIRQKTGIAALAIPVDLIDIAVDEGPIGAKICVVTQSQQRMLRPLRSRLDKAHPVRLDRIDRFIDQRIGIVIDATLQPLQRLDLLPERIGRRRVGNDRQPPVLIELRRQAVQRIPQQRLVAGKKKEDKVEHRAMAPLVHHPLGEEMAVHLLEAMGLDPALIAQILAPGEGFGLYCRPVRLCIPLFQHIAQQRLRRIKPRQSGVRIAFAPIERIDDGRALVQRSGQREKEGILVLPPCQGNLAVLYEGRSHRIDSRAEQVFQLEHLHDTGILHRLDRLLGRLPRGGARLRLRHEFVELTVEAGYKFFVILPDATDRRERLFDLLGRRTPGRTVLTEIVLVRKLWHLGIWNINDCTTTQLCLGSNGRWLICI